MKENHEAMSMVTKLRTQIKDLKKNEEEYLKRIENLEKQNSLQRTRTGSSSLSSSFVGDSLGNSVSGISNGDTLEEVWFAVKDITAKMDKIRTNIEKGSESKMKEIQNSLFSKENELFLAMNETDRKVREVKFEQRKEIKELRTKHREEISALNGELDNLKQEKISLLRKINELSLEKQTNILTTQKLKIANEQSEQMKKDLIRNESASSLDKEVIRDFMKQIEEKESMKANYEIKLSDMKRRYADSRSSLILAFRAALRRYVSKKGSDSELSEAYERLAEDDLKRVSQVFEENKVKVKKSQSK